MSEDVSPEIRHVRAYPEEITSNIPQRSWSQNSEFHRYRRTPDTALSDISDNVSPISTPVQLGLSPIPPLGGSMPFRPLDQARYISQPEESDYQVPLPERSPYRPTEQSRLEGPTIEIYSEPEFTSEEARAVMVPQIDPAAILTRPVAVTVRSRAETPPITAPRRQSQQTARQSQTLPHLSIPTRTSSQILVPQIRRQSQVRPSSLLRLLPPIPPQASTNTVGHHVEVKGGWRRPSQIIGREPTRWPKVIRGIIFLLIPIPFFALAIGLATMDGKPIDDKRQVWQDLMKVAGTFFPIVFALLIGRALVMVSSHLLELGTNLENLEQLMGSRTFSSSITTQVRLHSFNFLGFGLITLFILSPIGSQGFLRLLSSSTASKTSPSATPYFTTDTQSLFADTTLSSSPSTSSILRSMYNAAVLAPSSIKASPRDLWTNLKIPYLSSLTQANGSEYITITPNTTLVYTSLTGLPLGALQSGVTSLTLESSYLELNCGSPVRQSGFFSLTSFPSNTSPLPNGTYHGTSAGVNISGSGTATWSLGLNNFISPRFNTSTSIPSSPPKTCIPPTTNSPRSTQPFLSAPCALQSLSNDQVEPSTLLFQASVPNSADNSTVQAFCQTRTVYVQSEILCEGETPECRVVGQRKSQLLHAPEDLTPLAFPLIFLELSERLPRAFETSLKSTSPDPSILYLSNPDPAAVISTISADLTLLSGATLSRRLAQLINTYYTLSQGYNIITQGGSTAMQSWPNTPASVTLSAEFYKVSWGWFAFVFLPTLTMFIASIIGTIVDYKTRNPEILGFVSSVLRDSKYVNVEGNESNASGVEISRRNKEMRIKMGGLSEMEGAALVVGKEGDVVGRRSVRGVPV